MYYPYLRGKQFELITVRELAPLLAGSDFVPVIEPVREVRGLQRALDSICEANGRAVVVVNPHHGVFSADGETISALLQGRYRDRRKIRAGVLLKDTTTVRDAIECCRAHRDHNITLIHAGFTDAKGLAENLPDIENMRHIFLAPYCGRLYRRHFTHGRRALVRDGFQRRRNRDYPQVELFSDLHLTYEDEGVDGFGDFLIVGDDFSESGGPAYAVAIHLTFIDPTKDNAMYIYHFVSDRQDTPTDPAGKFGEALAAMMRKLREPNHHILTTDAVQEFRDLHDRGHFPGLGYIKKLSMKHHIETLSDFLRR